MASPIVRVRLRVASSLGEGLAAGQRVSPDRPAVILRRETVSASGPWAAVISLTAYRLPMSTLPFLSETANA